MSNQTQMILMVGIRTKHPDKGMIVVTCNVTGMGADIRLITERLNQSCAYQVGYTLDQDPLGREANEVLMFADYQTCLGRIKGAA